MGYTGRLVGGGRLPLDIFVRRNTSRLGRLTNWLKSTAVVPFGHI